jgi:L-threonylcarbamoyladenylate synthase
MKTQVISPANLAPAIEFLKKGIPIAFPTETVYGLGAQIFEEEAIDQIFTIKGRPSDNPLIVHVASMEQAVALCQNLPELFYRLIEKFWPGPLTLVVPKAPHICDRISGGLNSIAIRMPSNKIARDLINAVGPLAAPSANLSGKPSPTTATDVLEDLNGKIPLIIDGGECSFGIESTVLSLLDTQPMLLRPGSISKEEIENFLGQTIAEPDAMTKIVSPGMKYRHYAPKAKVRLAYEVEELDGYVLQPTEKNLYAGFRKADRLGIAEIVIDCTKPISKALMNRIQKAASC